MSDGEITWLRAAVLAAQNLRTHLSKAQRKRGFNLKRDIVPEIKRQGKKKFRGETPQNTLSAVIRKDFSQNAYTSKFLPVAGRKGRYILRIDKDSMFLYDDQIQTEEAHKSEREWVVDLQERFMQMKKDIQQLTQQGLPTAADKLLTDLLRRTEKFIADWSTIERRDIMLIGKTGVGKSFIMNTLARITMQQKYDSQRKYNRVQITTILHQAFQDLVEDWNLSREDQEELLDAIKTRQKNDFKVLEKLKQKILATEKGVASIIRDYHETGERLYEQTKQLENNPFVFPSLSTGDATTSFATGWRYGYIPALYVKYYNSSSEIPVPPNFNNDLDKYLTREKISRAEVEKNIEQKYEIYIGSGEDVTLDRVYVRDQYQNIRADKAKVIAIKDVHVYLPCAVLEHGTEIWDLPGFDDLNPIHATNLQQKLKTARIIWLITDKTLEASGLALQHIQDSGILYKILDDPPENLDDNIVKGSKEFLRGYIEDTFKKYQCDEALQAKDESIVDETNNRIDYVSFYPYLFQSLLLEEQERGKESAELLQQQKATGGYKVLGNLRKLLYGRTLSALDYFLEKYSSTDNCLQEFAAKVTLETPPPSQPFFQALQELSKLNRILLPKKFQVDFVTKMHKVIEDVVLLKFSDEHYPITIPKHQWGNLLARLRIAPDTVSEELRELFHSQDTLSYRKDATVRIRRALQWETIGLAKSQLILFNKFIVSQCAQERLNSFLEHFEYYHLYIQPELEKALTIQEIEVPDPRPITSHWFNDLIRTYLRTKRVTTVDELQEMLDALAKDAATKVRSVLVSTILMQIRDDICDSLAVSCGDYVRLLLLNKDVPIGGIIRKDGESSLYDMLHIVLNKLKNNYDKLRAIRREQHRKTTQNVEAEDIGLVMRKEGKFFPDTLAQDLPNYCVPSCPLNNEPVGSEETKNMVVCEYCHVWFHLKCYEDLYGSVDLAKDFYCVDCQKVQKVIHDFQAVASSSVATTYPVDVKTEIKTESTNDTVATVKKEEERLDPPAKKPKTVTYVVIDESDDETLLEDEDEFYYDEGTTFD